jgi:hypothetical protein
MMRSNTLRPGGRHRALVAVLAGSVALVVGLVCGGLLLNPGSKAQPTPRPAATTDGEFAATGADEPAPANPPAEPPTTSSTGDADQRMLPPDLAMTDVGGVRLPTSTSVGPWHSANGLAHGFSRDHAGAALAAAHILVRVHPEVGADVFGPTLSAQVIGPYVQVLRTNVEYAYGQLLTRWPVIYGQPAGSLDLSVLGFRVVEFSQDEATVDVLLEVPDGPGVLLGATTVRMRWHTGDWALIAPADGTFTATTLVEETTGFTLWQPRTAP